MWRSFIAQKTARRFLWTVGLGTMAFNMQDIVLEPYGGEILGLSVGATSALTALMAAGSLAAFALSARLLGRGADPFRVAAVGALLGLPAFAAVIFSAPLDSPLMFRCGVALIGFGGGLFAVGTLCAAMSLERAEHVGLALGAWGAVQATASGLSVGAGGAIRDIVSSLATQGMLGEALTSAVTGYSFVYHLEMYLLFATLVAIGPLVRATTRPGLNAQPVSVWPSFPASTVVRKENPMGTGAITQYVDVAQLVLYAFWIFFAALVYYLVRENHREGYPMETENGRGVITGWPIPEPKTYKLAHGGEAVVPNADRLRRRRCAPSRRIRWAGAPLVPTGDNPMLDGVGPGAWADRADVPDMDFEGQLKIVPLRVASDFQVSAKDNDPRGLPVVGGDGEVGGTVVDLWVDKAESLFRYLEVETTGGGRRVLLPINFARIGATRSTCAPSSASTSPPCRARAAPTR